MLKKWRHFTNGFFMLIYFKLMWYDIWNTFRSKEKRKKELVSTNYYISHFLNLEFIKRVYNTYTVKKHFVFVLKMILVSLVKILCWIFNISEC